MERVIEFNQTAFYQIMTVESPDEFGSGDAKFLVVCGLPQVCAVLLPFLIYPFTRQDSVKSDSAEMNSCAFMK